METPKLCKTCFWWDVDYGCANEQAVKLDTFCYGYDNNKIVSKILMEAPNEKNKKDI